MIDQCVYIVAVGSCYVSDMSGDEKSFDLDSDKYHEFYEMIDAHRIATKIGGKVVKKKTTYTFI
ncbi:hypothetical protein [Bacillus phage vB_Bsu_hmny2]